MGWPLLFYSCLSREHWLREIIKYSPNSKTINYLARITPINLIGLVLGSNKITPEGLCIIRDRLKNEVLKNTSPKREKFPISRSRLRMLDIELTERCNLECCHCYIKQNLNNETLKSQEMTTEFIRSLLLQGVEFGLKAVRFSGGEPTVRGDFMNLFQYAIELGLDVSLSTNGTLITESIAKFFAQHPPCAVSISVYGWDNVSCEAITNRSKAFEAFLTGVRLLKKYKISFDIKFPPIRMLIDNSDKLIRLGNALGSNRPVPHPWELTLRARREEKANERIRTMRFSPFEAAIQRLQISGLAMKDYRAFVTTDGRHFTGKLFNCRAGKDRLTIDCYGNLQLCLELRHPSMIYNLQSGSLREAIDKFIPEALSIKIENEDTIKRCSKCILYKKCMTCPAVSWTENGTLDKISEYHCEVMHNEAWLLGVLREGQKGWEENFR